MITRSHRLPLPAITQLRALSSHLWELFRDLGVLFAVGSRSAEAQGTYTDEQLVLDFREGDRRAFEALVLRYQDRAFRFCLRYIGNRERAEELAQETFVRVYKNLHSFRGESSFSSWFYSVMSNHCKNRVRAAVRRKERMHDSIDAPRSEEDTRGLELPDSKPDAQALMEVRQRQLLLQAALAGLEPDERAILILREVEGQAYEDIALALDLPLGTVKSRIYRARQALKDRVNATSHGRG